MVAGGVGTAGRGSEPTENNNLLRLQLSNSDSRKCPDRRPAALFRGPMLGRSVGFTGLPAHSGGAGSKEATEDSHWSGD